MKLKSIIKDLPEKIGNIEFDNVTDDSRKVNSKSAFVCIKGPISDGHDYAESAVRSGAAVVICEKDLGLENQVIVPDTHKALAQLCDFQYNYPLKKLKVIGVTGTNGKTSVCTMLKTILENYGYKTGVIGTIEHIIADVSIPSKNTTPGIAELRELFAKMVDAGCEYAVMEVSSHALDQRRVEGIDFEVGIFTNLTQDHLDYHKTMDAYFEAKAKLFLQCKKAVINIDDPYGEKLKDLILCDCSTYSAKADESTFSAKNINYKPEGVDYEMVGFGIIGRVHLQIAGRFSVYNSLAAGVCAKELGLPVNEITESLSSIKGVKGRAEVVPTGKDFTVIIDYAHTPDGLQNILTTFRECPKNRLIVVFGCGGDRDKTKRPQMGTIAARLADYVIVTSDNPRTEVPSEIIKDIVVGMKGITTQYKIIENRIEAIKFAVANAKSGDIIVLAGKGHETYQIIGHDTVHLDEREVVAEALAQL